MSLLSTKKSYLKEEAAVCKIRLMKTGCKAGNSGKYGPGRRFIPPRVTEVRQEPIRQFARVQAGDENASKEILHVNNAMCFLQCSIDNMALVKGAQKHIYASNDIHRGGLDRPYFKGRSIEWALSHRNIIHQSLAHFSMFSPI